MCQNYKLKKNLNFEIYDTNMKESTMKANERYQLHWQTGFSREKSKPPAEWHAAVVPGAVQLDYARSKDWPPYDFSDNYKNYAWMEDVYWFYRTTFSKPTLKEGEKVFFVSKGIDYCFEIFCNENRILKQEGMYTAVSEDITPYLKDENELWVVILPAPKVFTHEVSRFQADRSCKPPSSYGWDWHPRLIPLGIWDETGIEVRKQSFVTQILPVVNLSDDLTSAQIKITMRGAHIKQLAAALYDPSGRMVAEKNLQQPQSEPAEVDFLLENPVLWWPIGFGEQNLYKVKISLWDEQEKEEIGSVIRCFGIRKTRLVMNMGAWDEPTEFPKSRSVPPITLEINNKRVFAKGTNWVQPEIFYGTIDKQRYEELLDRAVEANFNIIRVWGGGPVNKDAFYEICDEKGLMVWQEFPLACMEYEGTPEYLRVLEQEAVSIVEKLRHHPCLVLWCGGNELYNDWSGMTDQSAALRLLNSITYRMDRQTPFLPTAPVTGMGHGHYLFRDSSTGEEVFQWMPRSRNTAYSEFAIPSPASKDVLARIIPDEELFPPKPGTSWETHHAFHAWQGDTWLCLDMLTYYFGQTGNLDALIDKGQTLQGEGLKFIFEEARRQEPYCSMALNWCFNEPWPTAANTSILSYPAIPKPAFDEVKQACRKALVSARVPKFKWTEGELFSAEIFFLNHLLEEDIDKLTFSSFTVEVYLKMAKQNHLLLSWRVSGINETCNEAGPVARFLLPSMPSGMIELCLQVKENTAWDSKYRLWFEAKPNEKEKDRDRLN